MVVALGDGVDGSTSLKSGEDAVGRLLGLVVSASNTDETIFYRVGLLNACIVLDDVERVLSLVLVRTYECTWSNAVETCSDVSWK